MFTTDDGRKPTLERRTAKQLTNVDFTPDLVFRTLIGLTSSTSSGPDGIPNIFLKRCASGLALPLCHIFDFSFKTQRLPKDWKKAYITPIHKKGTTSSPGNYRPISLTSTCCRAMERIINKAMHSYLGINKLISSNQHGFRGSKSTCTNLLECTYEWSNSIQSRTCSDVIYFDFKKAFDSVSHPKLLTKLESYGVGGSLLVWLKNFLSDRVQVVRIEGRLYDTKHVTSGVPQGSVLGPTLFLLYINDIVDKFNNLPISYKLFADDIKLYSKTSNSHELQESINQLVAWAGEWQLQLAEEKCFVCTIKSSSKNNPPISYSVRSHQLESTTSIRDLGVYIDSNLKFNSHIDHVVRTASIRARLIHKSFFSRDQTLLCRAFCVYVRPILEYCSPVWSPYRKHQIAKLERVQRQFTKAIHPVRHLSYPARLAALGLRSLEHRRLVADLCLCYKMINGMIDSEVKEHFQFMGETRTRGHDLKLRQSACRCDITKYYFTSRVVGVWNALPGHVVAAETISSFRCQLDSVLNTII